MMIKKSNKGTNISNIGTKFCDSMIEEGGKKKSQNIKYEVKISITQG